MPVPGAATVIGRWPPVPETSLPHWSGPLHIARPRQEVLHHPELGTGGAGGIGDPVAVGVDVQAEIRHPSGDPDGQR